MAKITGFSKSYLRRIHPSVRRIEGTSRPYPSGSYTHGREDQFIFGSTSNSSLEPFLIGLYVGQKYPKSVDLFMYHFTSDLTKMISCNGLFISDGEEERRVLVRIRFYVIDTPKRGYVVSTR